jgi:hypothetical protein
MIAIGMYLLKRRHSSYGFRAIQESGGRMVCNHVFRLENRSSITDQRHTRTLKPGSRASPEEVKACAKLLELSRRCSIPDDEILNNLGLFHVRGSFARMLFMHTLYLRALNAHGVMMEFGVRWGQNMALLFEQGA